MLIRMIKYAIANQLELTHRIIILLIGWIIILFLTWNPVEETNIFVLIANFFIFILEINKIK